LLLSWGVALQKPVRLAVQARQTLQMLAILVQRLGDDCTMHGIPPPLNLGKARAARLRKALARAGTLYLVKQSLAKPR